MALLILGFDSFYKNLYHIYFIAAQYNVVI